jgi:predicted  nucleic acid-binding Zn-ribbon protein
MICFLGMKWKMSRCTFVLSAVLAGVNALSIRSGNGTTPIDRVTNLLTDLKAKVAEDGKKEELVYNKYACWCEKATSRKANDISDAEQDLRGLGQQILSLKGKIATLTAEIKEIEGQLEDNEEQQDKATSVRQKRNAEFQTTSSETKQALTAVQSAIKVLVKGTKFMQMDSTVAAQTTLAVKSVLEKLPSNVHLDKGGVSMLSEFVNNMADNSYAPQSATLQGILTDMYTTFSNDLMEATTTEANQQAHFEKLIATLTKEANELKEVKSRKESEKTDAESSLADATSTYDETTEQMEADIKFFDETKAACSRKHEEWEKRQALRDDELHSITKALEIFESDENRELFESSIKPGFGVAASFLQVDDAQSVAFKGYSILKTMASRSKSVRLARLAVRVRTMKFGHFEQVIHAIDKMLQELQDEGAADRAKKTQCENNYQELKSTVRDLDWKIKNNDAKIDKLDGLIEKRHKERQETIDQMKETQDYMTQITSAREAENQAFLQAKEEDTQTIKLIEMAKDFLVSYYKKHKIPLNLNQQEPTFAIDADQAPDATFSHKGSNKLQAADIASLMEYIIEDVQNEIATATKDEAKNQAAYEEEMDTSKKLFEDLDSKRTNLESIIAKRQEEKSDEIELLKTNEKDKDAALKYKSEITPDCDWILKAFTERATARAAEMDGLTSAKEFLAGKQALFQQKKNAQSLVFRH